VPTISNRSPLPNRDPSASNEAQGLHHKYDVRRVDGSDGPGGKHQDCEYFVLDLDHDPHAIAALRAYVDSVETTHPLLASDMRTRYWLGHEKAQS